MNKILSLFFLFFTYPVYAWNIDGLGQYKFELINNTHNVYIMHGPLGLPTKQNTGFMNNPAMIISQQGVIIIDPGSTYDVGVNVISEIKKITNKPVLAVFNTHIHGDHWFANHAFKQYYPNAKFYGSQNMIDQANGEKAIIWLNSMNSMTEGLSKNTIITPPNLITENHQKIQIDDQSFVIYLTNLAHTNTDIMIEHVQSKTLFLGDNGFNGRFGQFDDSSNIQGNIKALQLAQQLDINYYVPGHGQSGQYIDVVKPYLNYLLMLKRTVAKGFEEGLEDYEIKDKIELEFSQYNGWVGFNIVFGKHVNKMYLETESNYW
ncbi:MAG: MBL fold metallo-hydrolase [Gammaproteobacteria bacterium]|nr:MBL fold metallo-hydrolase [Gammaproteobacteria bacterium]